MNKNELLLILEEGEGYKIEFREALTNIDREIVSFAIPPAASPREKKFMNTRLRR